MIGKTFGMIGVFAGAALGATVGSWAQAPYPISILERNVLTPIVRPGDPVLIELVTDRRQRCDQTVTRFIQNPDNTRSPNELELPSTYGRMGRDVYVIKVPTDPKAPYGEAEIYSTGKARCNLYQQLIKEVESGDPWHDKFAFGPETVRKPAKHPDMARENP